MSKRFTIRTALIVIGFVAVALGVMANRASEFRNQRRLCADLQQVECFLFSDKGADARHQQFDLFIDDLGYRIAELPVLSANSDISPWSLRGNQKCTGMFVTDSSDVSAEQLETLISRSEWIECICISEKHRFAEELDNLKKQIPDVRFEVVRINSAR